MQTENKTGTIELYADDFVKTLAQEGLLASKPEKTQVTAKPTAAPSNSCSYWEALQINAVKSTDREFLTRYHELAAQGKTNDEIGNALGIKRSTLFYRLKKIKNIIALKEILNINDRKRWFYYLSRGLQKTSLGS